MLREFHLNLKRENKGEGRGASPPSGLWEARTGGAPERAPDLSQDELL